MALLNLGDSGQFIGVDYNSFRIYQSEIIYPYTKMLQTGIVLNLCNLIFINFQSFLSFIVCHFSLLSACLTPAVFSPFPIQLTVSDLLLMRLMSFVRTMCVIRINSVEFGLEKLFFCLFVLREGNRR